MPYVITLTNTLKFIPTQPNLHRFKGYLINMILRRNVAEHLGIDRPCSGESKIYVATPDNFTRAVSMRVLSTIIHFAI